MKIAIIKATFEEKPILQNMMQLYQYDFSEFEGTDLNESGLYEYKYLDLYWEEPERTPLIIRVDENLAGFVLINKHSYSGQDRFCIAEFFIMRKYRRKGIGKQVAFQVFDQSGPRWEVQQTQENTAAQSFWLDVISDYTKGDYELHETGLGDWCGPIILFNRR